jgi:hypothetical protein
MQMKEAKAMPDRVPEADGPCVLVIYGYCGGLPWYVTFQSGAEAEKEAARLNCLDDWAATVLESIPLNHSTGDVSGHQFFRIGPPDHGWAIRSGMAGKARWLSFWRATSDRSASLAFTSGLISISSLIFAFDIEAEARAVADALLAAGEINIEVVPIRSLPAQRT